MNKLVPFLGNMGIKLSHEELEDFSQNLPVDGEHCTQKCTPFRTAWFESIHRPLIVFI